MDNLKDFNAEEIFELSQERGGIVLYTGSRHLSMFDVLLELQELQVLKIIGIVILIISILGCFFGYKIARVFIAICGFIVGMFIGIGVASVLRIELEKSGTIIAIVLICGIIFAILSYKFYKIGVFIMTFLNSGLFMLLVGSDLLKNEEQALVLALIAGIVIAIIAVMFTKPMIIITTSVTWGKIAGLFLAVLLKNEMMSNILPWIFIAAGIFVQIKTNGGLEGLMEGIGKKAGDQVEYEKFMK